MEIKDVLKHLRKQNNITQVELAKALNISKSTIAMIESGERKPSTELYEAIADYFDVDIDYLYGRTDIPKKIIKDGDTDIYFANVNDFFLNAGDITQVLLTGGKLMTKPDDQKRISNIIEVLEKLSSMPKDDKIIVYSALKNILGEDKV